MLFSRTHTHKHRISFARRKHPKSTIRNIAIKSQKNFYIMIKQLFLTAAFAAFAALPAAAQTNVVHRALGVTADGATYCLPKTAVRFVITATCTTRHAGPYAQYAERFLGIEDAISEDVDSWTLDSITATTYSLPDTSETYTIEFNPKTSAPLVTLSPEGILLAINDEGDYAYTLPEGGVRNIEVANPDPADHYSEDFLRAGSMVKKAEILAEEIYDIREKRMLIAGGEADFNPTDGEQLRLMLERQDAKEAALKTLFTGTISKKVYTYTIDYTPRKTKDSQILFRFSERLGLVDNDDLAGEPYTLTLTDETTRPQAPTDNAATAKSKKKKPAKTDTDVCYRMPGRGRLIIADSKHKVYEQSFPVAQFGHIEHLRGTLFDKKYNTKIQFNPLTGNIRHIDTINY